MKSLIFCLLILLFVSGCVTTTANKNTPSKILMQFAYANCLMWYLEDNNYDSNDVRAIAGGIVETSDISLDKFQDIALFVKSYDPKLETKQNIDRKLLRCFHLDSSKELKAIISL